MRGRQLGWPELQGRVSEFATATTIDENTGPRLPGKPRGVAARDHRAATPTPNNTGGTRFGLSPSPILALPRVPYEPRILALNCADAFDHRVQRSIGQKRRFERGSLAQTSSTPQYGQLSANLSKTFNKMAGTSFLKKGERKAFSFAYCILENGDSKNA